MLYTPANTGIESRRYLRTKSLSALTLQGTFLIWSHSVPSQEALTAQGQPWGDQPCADVTSLPPPLLLFQSRHHIPNKSWAVTALNWRMYGGHCPWSVESNLARMQVSVVHYPGWIFLAWQTCKLCLKCALLTVMFPARKNPHFPVSAIWHRGCIDLLMDLTKGITWNACGRCVNEDSPPCAHSLNFNGNEQQTTDASL